MAACIGAAEARGAGRVDGYVEAVEHGAGRGALIEAVEAGPVADHEHVAGAEALGDFIEVPMLHQVGRSQALHSVQTVKEGERPLAGGAVENGAQTASFFFKE